MYRTSSELILVENRNNAALRVEDSGERGRGVFAAEPIAAGALVERSPVIIVPEEDRAAVDPSSVGYHIFMWEPDSVGDDIYSGEGRVAVVLGYASLVNHSEDPNCRFVRYIEGRVLDVIALRDIAAGEEITFHYGMKLWFTPG